MYIPKIENGKVQLYNERGIFQRTISSTDPAVFADINAAQTLIVITRKTGNVDIFNEKGIIQRTISRGSDATSAKWVGSDIAITRKSGKVDIVDEKGYHKKTIF